MWKGMKVIDADAHMHEPEYLWERYVEPKFRDRVPKVAPTRNSTGEFCFPSVHTKRTDRIVGHGASSWEKRRCGCVQDCDDATTGVFHHAVRVF